MSELDRRRSDVRNIIMDTILCLLSQKPMGGLAKDQTC